MTSQNTREAPQPVKLRPFEESDLEIFRRYASEPEFSRPFQWGGFISYESFRQRWQKDGFLEGNPRYLAVSREEESCLGWVMWRDPYLFGSQGWAWEIGAFLAPEHRGQGAGSAAHRQLVEHLFETTTVHRLCAHTDVANVAEQRCLEKCGFRREGVLRQAGFRAGAWHDATIYGLLREDWSP